MSMHDTTDPDSQPDVQPNIQLDALLADLGAHYPVAFEPVTLSGGAESGAAGLTLDVLQIQDLAAYLDTLLANAGQKAPELPLFAKLWPASLMLGSLLARMTLPDGARVLELGAGVGLCGMVTAARGLPTTLSDAHPHALGFLKAGVLKNGLAETATVQPLDIKSMSPSPMDAQRYDLLLAVEPDLDDGHVRGLAKFLIRHIAPKATSQVLLAFNYDRPVKKLLSLLDPEFRMQQQVVGAKAGEARDDRHLVAIYRCTPRKVL